uniref:CSON013155 protein n=1 Tax=Culicoides sonorensis TaxID=179676 RepID=A0A336MA18_CULSO
MAQTVIDNSQQECFIAETSNDKSELEEFPWLTPKYIENVLINHLNDSTLQVQSMKTVPAAGKGDGYGGIMLRSYISYHSNESVSPSKTSLVLKTQIWNNLTENTLKVYDIHNKEMIIYESILPKIRLLLSSIGETGDIFPIAICVDRENDVIIFEDLLLKHYKMKNRIEGLDRDHTVMALSKLAKLHAASAVLFEKDNEIYSSLKSGMFTRKTNCYYTFFRTFWTACAEEVCQWKGFEKYGEKMMNMLDDLIENACKMYDIEDGDLHVLTHGDFWLNNIMYNYDEDGNLKDAVVLDWQYSSYAFPILDFLLFIYTSTNDDIRLNHADLFQIYYNELVSTLKKLNYSRKIPTLFEFRHQYLKKSFLKLTSCIMMLPSMINEVNDDADFESLMLDDEKARRFKKTIMSNPKYRTILQKLLPIFDSEGLMDPLFKHLTNEYLEKVLREYYEDQTIIVHKFDATLAAMENGANYVGLVLRLKIHFKHGSNTFAKSLIIKSTLPDPKMKEIVKNYKLFDKEMMMFESILPKYNKILGKNEPLLCAESIKMDWENMTLIFEDLQESGFVVADRTKGVDMAHVNILMKHLAKYHACSMVLAEKEGVDDFKEFHTHMISENSPEALKHFNNMFKELSNAVKSWRGYEKYGEKLENLQSKFLQQTIDVYKKCKSKTKVVIHGDLWTSNFMFKYDAKNNPIAAKLIDLQIVYYGSPIFDLIYFLVTSVEDEIRFNRSHEVIQIYYLSLVEELNKLNFKGYIPTLYELYHEYVEKSFFEVFTASSLLCLVLNEQKEGATLDNMMQDTEDSMKFRRQMFKNQNYQRILKRYLPIWDKKGLLDPLYN